MRRSFLHIACVCLGLASMPAAAQSNAPTATPFVANNTIFVYSAGSLRAPLTQLAKSFEQSYPQAKLELVFGASGLLKDRILAQSSSEPMPAHVFTSANMEHPQALAATGRFGAVQLFTRNRLCALVAPSAQDIAGKELAITSSSIVSILRNPRIKLGTSTPVADPSGDYTWQMFDRIESSGTAPAGSAAALKARALQLTGGPNSPAPPANRNVYGVLAANGSADVFITYCTNARIAVAQEPSLRIVQLPDTVNVSADYGLAVAQHAPALAQAFAQYLQSGAGQAVLQQSGFAAITP